MAVPALVVLTMGVAGLGLTVEDFRRVGRRPWLFAQAVRARDRGPGGAGAADRLSVGAVFVARNVGVAMPSAATALGRLEVAVFATAYFLAQTPLLLAAVFLVRRGATAAREPRKTERPNDEPDIRAAGRGATP